MTDEKLDILIKEIQDLKRTIYALAVIQCGIQLKWLKGEYEKNMPDGTIPTANLIDNIKSYLLREGYGF